MSYTKFGERVRAMRLERGLSQTSLARAAGVTQGTLSHAEDGARPLSSEVVDRLAAVLGADPWELVRATDAEGKYVSARLSADAVEARKAADQALACLHLDGLLTVYGRLFALCRAVWSHGVCLGDPRHEAMRETLASLCQPWFPILERLGYADVREHVGIPPAILDAPEVLPECIGEEWEYAWEPMLVRGERWIVLNLARVGGRPADHVLESSGHARLEAAMRGWDELIADIDRGNARYFTRLLAATKRKFSAGETASP
jgi:transcriptional regulator with XRE-family HTH domain